MPSSTPLARPHGRRWAGLLAALVLALACLLGLAPPQSIAAPADPAETPLTLDLVSLTPVSVSSSSTVTAKVQVTNTSASAVAAPVMDLRVGAPRITSRGDLSAWENRTDVSASGTVRASSDAKTEDLAAGASRTFTVSVKADKLGLGDEDWLWGARRTALTVRSQGTDLATLRTFLVWRPSGATESVAQSVLLPVTADDPGQVATDPTAFAENAHRGRLSERLRLAERSDVDWLLDPALLDPPALATEKTAEGVTEPTTAPSAQPSETADASSTTTPAPSSSDTAAPTSSPTAATESDSSQSTATSVVYEPSSASEEVADTLKDRAGSRTVLTVPYARADLVSIRSAGLSNLPKVLEDSSAQALKDAGIESRGTVLSVRGEQATADSLAQARDAGADVLLTPSSSLREDPVGTIVPSSAAVLREKDSSTPVLAPDPVLSDQLGSITSAADGERVTQRMLAETAVIASEYTTADRQVLISPDASSGMDAEQAGAALDAMDQAPWIRSARTGDLLKAAESESWADGPEAKSGLYAIGTIGAAAVHPSTRGTDGQWITAATAQTSPLLPAAPLRSAQRTAARTTALGSVMEDPAPTEQPRQAALSAASIVWRGDDGLRATGRADRAKALSDAVAGKITAVPASSYNLLASSSGVPITVTNDLSTPVTVDVVVSADANTVRLPEPSRRVTVPPQGQTQVRMPVEAVANGTVNLEVTLQAESGRELSPARSVRLTVNPSWENWTTMALVVAMGVLVVIGVLRARRTGSSRRGPAQRGPEDPELLAATGISRPASPAADAEARGDAPARTPADHDDHPGSR